MGPKGGRLNEEEGEQSCGRQRDLLSWAAADCEEEGVEAEEAGAVVMMTPAQVCFFLAELTRFRK